MEGECERIGKIERKNEISDEIEKMKSDEDRNSSIENIIIGRRKDKSERKRKRKSEDESKIVREMRSIEEIDSDGGS